MWNNSTRYSPYSTLFPSSFHPNRRQFAKYQHFKKQSRFLAQILFFCYQRKLNNIVLTVKTYNYEKLFVAAALVMGLGTSAAFADNFMVDSVTVTMINDFTPIEVKDLPAAVQEAITKNYAEATIKEAAVEANEDGTKTYKVVLTDEEGTESTVLFSESGEVLK